MRAILHLCCVIYGCTFVTYDGSRQRVRKSRTPQPCPRTAAAVRSSARCGSADGARPQGLSASGLSLSAAGPSFRQPVPIGDTKVAFTVKLSQELVRRVRSFANTTVL